MNPTKEEREILKALNKAERIFQKSNNSESLMKRFRQGVIELQNMVAENMVQRGRLRDFDEEEK
jgi:hypothetical protein